MAKKEKDFSDLEDRGKRLEALINLSNDLRDKELRLPIPFNDFLHSAEEQPEIVFRDIFQLFHDMVHYYVPRGVDEYEDSPDTVGFADYDCYNLFQRNCDEPFFADRLFANRFMNLARGFNKGIQNNLIYLFEGPPGSGKSTFLNNLLLKLEEFTKIPEGVIYETLWRIDVDKLESFKRKLSNDFQVPERNETREEIDYDHLHFDIPCPNHDHPILQIPKDYRKKFLDELIYSKKFKEKLFHDKEYKWVLRDEPCSICNSIYHAIFDEVGDPLKVFNMLSARKMIFNRQFGRGISIFNPGDQIFHGSITNVNLQNKIDELIKSSEIRYVYSHLANTNNGVYALMDIKEHNIERLTDLHGIISDGVHKVELVEERIKSLFVGLVNPEDKKHYQDVKSFQDRIITVNIPYILDYNTEVSIYKNKFGEEIEERFMPGVLQNFAKIIISTRLERESEPMQRWIVDPEKYSKYLDKNMLLLKMEIYIGKIPSWLSEEDLKRFTRPVRKEILAESDYEGRKGFSGRQSLLIFNLFLSKYTKRDKAITMDMVKCFFELDNEILDKEIPEGFITSLEDMYDYNVLQDVKEAVYFYNESQISRDILNYLNSINFDIGSTERCEYTGDTIEITEDFFKNFEAMFLGATSNNSERLVFRKNIQNEYITKTLSQEIRVEKKDITETQQFKSLFEKYTRNLKENALAPYTDNDNFRSAIKDFGTPLFQKYDNRLKQDVTQMISNLKKKFNYTPEGAKQVSLYVLDKKLASKY